MRPERYNAKESEPKWQNVWEERDLFRDPQRRSAAEILRPRDVPVPVGTHPYGPCPQLHDGRRGRALQARQGLQRAASDGLGRLRHAGRERGDDRTRSTPRTGPTPTSPTMRAQLQSMGLSIDWSREIATCDPSYYKHQQRMFLDFLAGGLVDRKTAKVNWDPVDQTVLANEQVIDGRGWRSGALGRAARADAVVLQDHRLRAGSARHARRRSTAGPKKSALMQRNWIGRSEGLLVRFALDPATTPNGESELEIYTTRPDTLFGAKFMAVAPDHPLAKAAAAKQPGARGLHRGVQAHRHRAGGDRDGREEGLRHRHPRRASVRPELDAARLRRQFRPDGIRHGRDLRLPGARPARPRFRQQIRPRRHPGGLPARRQDPATFVDHRHRL